MKNTTKTDMDERNFEFGYQAAIDNIKNWRAYVGDIDTPSAYFLHKEDLLFLINELMNLDAKGMGIRCYPARNNATGENHLLMVAVVEEEGYPNGKDIYIDQNDHPLEESRIFDLSRPCPNMCDDKSALFKASIAKAQLPLSELKSSRKID